MLLSRTYSAVQSVPCPSKLKTKASLPPTVEDDDFLAFTSKSGNGDQHLSSRIQFIVYGHGMVGTSLPGVPFLACLAPRDSGGRAIDSSTANSPQLLPLALLFARVLQVLLFPRLPFQKPVRGFTMHQRCLGPCWGMFTRDVFATPETRLHAAYIEATAIIPSPRRRYCLAWRTTTRYSGN